MPFRAFLIITFIQTVIGQTTYTGCHNHSNVEWCYGGDGIETPLVTYSDTSTLITATLPASVVATATTTGQTTIVTGCHGHGTDIYCIDGNGDEVLISLTGTPTGATPAQYTDCHSHNSELYCLDEAGEDVRVVTGGDIGDDTGDAQADENSKLDCHFHAGVEHCVASGSENETTDVSCELQERDYNIGLRAGTLFVVLVTSGIGVFIPLSLTKSPLHKVNGVVFIIVRQFGTGVIISTAFIHLYTHAYLMFTNPCLGSISYEATTSAVVMAGIFLAFLFEYGGRRFILSRSPSQSQAPEQLCLPTSSVESRRAVPEVKEAVTSSVPNNMANLGHNHGSPFDLTKLSVLVMEAGILFHSILIGLTLVVAGDSFYKTLLVVIVFHQFFEGLALGARIALLQTARFWPTKFTMATSFALITPLGMAIGLGVIKRFNGNDRGTVITIGTLDALSCGILVWVGMVDMLARDWILDGGELTQSGTVKTFIGGLGLIAGMTLMSVLGKWV